MTSILSMNSLRVLLFVLLALGFVGCGEKPDPLSNGEFLRTTDRKFEAVRDKGEILTLTYSVDVVPANPLSKPLYLETHFENPAENS